MTNFDNIEHNKGQQWLNEAILFYGPRKAGTTMTLNLVDGGEEMFVSPAEIKLKKFLFYDWSNPQKNQNQYLNASTITGRTFKNFDMDSYMKSMAQTGAFRDLKSSLLYDVYCQYISMQKRPRFLRKWAIKEVGGDTNKVISGFRHLFPAGKVVMVIRSPKKISQSVIRNRARRKMKMKLRNYYKQIRDPLIVLSKQGRFYGQEGIHFVAYEHLINESSIDRSLVDLCEFLGVDRNENFDFTSEYGVEAVSRTSSKSTSKIFPSNNEWTEGLNTLEIFLVKLVYALVTLELIVRGDYKYYKKMMSLI